ncbi:response regulator [Nitrospina watsonii]|uniref:Response regulatory domain-containing protein n=1 Tax=Nitrospina watsonii TaxID=1323948 RepID=A0ABN8VZG8_9BACT|nr:response regulator [Nitrospina watsonii]CAI2717371.1 Response regulatory domain-containing protein [Nitrospina watsonii]
MKLKILVADDSISIQKLVSMAFYNEDMEVEGISDGVKAYNYLSDFQPDLVMADIYLPGINGFELSKKIKNSDEFQNVHVLLLTSDFEELDQIMYADSEADGYISKPFKTDEIIKKVKHLLGEDTPAAAATEDEEYEIESGEYEIEAVDEVEIDAGDEDKVDVESAGILDYDEEGLQPKWIELSAEDLVIPNRDTATPEPAMEIDDELVLKPEEAEAPHSEPLPQTSSRTEAFQESLDELDQLFRQLTERSRPPAADPEPETGASKLEPSSHPDLIREVMTLMNEERPSSNGKHATPAPKPSHPAETDHSALHDLVHQHVRATLRTEMAGLSDTIQDTVRQIVEDVAPEVIREVIREEIARIKKSEPI